MEKQAGSYQCSGRGPWIAGRIAKGIVIGLVFALVFGIFVRLLWNWLMPGIFGIREITYGQSIGMIILARLLLGHGGRGMRPGSSDKWHGRSSWAWGGPCTKGDAPNGEITDWRHYDSWWNAEGRDAFKKYCDSKGK